MDITTIDIGPNLTAVMIAIIAGVPSIVAAFYARKANSTAASTHDLVNSQTDALLAASNSVAFREGVDAGAAAKATEPDA